VETDLLGDACGSALSVDGHAAAMESTSRPFVSNGAILQSRLPPNRTDLARVVPGQELPTLEQRLAR